MGIVTKVEEIISIPLEIFHNRKGFHPVDLNRLALRCMEKGIRKGIHKAYAPNRFRVLLNPTDYQELYPFLETICSDISGELRRMVDERRYQLAGDLSVKIIRDPASAEGLPQVKGFMEGGEETESTVSRSKDDASAYRRESSCLDAETVIVLSAPKPESRAEKALEEGITILREGRAVEAQEVLSRAEEDLCDQPQFHAAMAVALEMLGRRAEALTHYERLLAMDRSRPEVRRRIEWIQASGLPLLPQGLNPVAYGRLEFGRSGAVLLIHGMGLSLENRKLDPHVSVDGKVVPETLLTDSAKIRIGDIEIIYRAGQENP